jgi:hypothetical protein
MKLRILTFIAMALVVALVAAGCGNGVEPTPLPTSQATCNVTINGQSVTITGPVCGSGNGTVTQPAPTPAPSASPAASACIKRTPIYQDNVVNAWRSIATPEKTLAGHIAALVAALKAAQFEATSGGLLSIDEIAVKAKGGAFSETYDVGLGDLSVHVAQVLYVATCTPASF